MTPAPDPGPTAPDLDTLPGLLDHAWQHLTLAVATAQHGFHLPTLCTVNRKHQPAARIVVLRRFDRHQRAVVCHTDIRSPKIHETQENPRAAWVFYDGPARLQLRAKGVVQFHRYDVLADEQWAASNLSSRRCYLAPSAPGTPTDHPSPNLPPEVREHVPAEKDTLPGRDRFAVLRCVIDNLDVLHLHHAGHRRACYTWDTSNPHAPPDTTWIEV